MRSRHHGLTSLTWRSRTGGSTVNWLTLREVVGRRCVGANGGKKVRGRTRKKKGKGKEEK